MRINSKVQYRRRTVDSTADDEEVEILYTGKSEVLYVSKYIHEGDSGHSLHPVESERVARLSACKKVSKDKQFIVNMLYDLLQKVTTLSAAESPEKDLLSRDSETSQIVRQLGKEKLARMRVDFDSAAAGSTSALPDSQKADAEVPEGESESKDDKDTNLKSVSVETEKDKKQRATSSRVQISEPENMDETTETVQDAEKETQTSKEKEKQD